MFLFGRMIVLIKTFSFLLTLCLSASIPAGIMTKLTTDRQRVKIDFEPGGTHAVLMGHSDLIYILLLGSFLFSAFKFSFFH